MSRVCLVVDVDGTPCRAQFDGQPSDAQLEDFRTVMRQVIARLPTQPDLCRQRNGDVSYLPCLQPAGHGGRHRTHSGRQWPDRTSPDGPSTPPATTPTTPHEQTGGAIE